MVESKYVSSAFEDSENRMDRKTMHSRLIAETKHLPDVGVKEVQYLRLRFEKKLTLAGNQATRLADTHLMIVSP
ncbi:hypothetical protein I7I53_00227 [Histoplasma capsulatum var. duboisii H88]|uniref:Uncharacterized protein n=1 Tax=Ajellomyces capsulatus (strain H88) TaxID=544711 RepID=A0A8A1LG88_AJEC8|nr:hypothetical protein I7I53_00227 [Histoplasma capsulatum var. duboisii H88]